MQECPHQSDPSAGVYSTRKLKNIKKLYTEQMHENLRTQKYFKLQNSRIKVDKMIKLKKCSFIILSSKQKEEREGVRKMNLTTVIHLAKHKSVHPNMFFLLMLFTFIPLLIFIKVKTFNFALEMGAMYKLTKEISRHVIEKFNGTS